MTLLSLVVEDKAKERGRKRKRREEKRHIERWRKINKIMLKRRSEWFKVDGGDNDEHN